MALKLSRAGPETAKGGQKKGWLHQLPDRRTWTGCRRTRNLPASGGRLACMTFTRTNPDNGPAREKTDLSRDAASRAVAPALAINRARSKRCVLIRKSSPRRSLARTTAVAHEPTAGTWTQIRGQRLLPSSSSTSRPSRCVPGGAEALHALNQRSCLPACSYLRHLCDADTEDEAEIRRAVRCADAERPKWDRAWDGARR